MIWNLIQDGLIKLFISESWMDSETQVSFYPWLELRICKFGRGEDVIFDCILTETQKALVYRERKEQNRLAERSRKESLGTWRKRSGIPDGFQS